jgi:integrase
VTHNPVKGVKRPVPETTEGKTPALGDHQARKLLAAPVGDTVKASNLDRRTREYLTPAEVEKLLQASSKVGRHGVRDRTLILLAYRYGLRVLELVTMRWEQI